MLYRRNRYYDPEAGTFTQGDPIGIAGGLNLYGYAGGDPINYSDPFGLSECEKIPGEDERRACETRLAAQGEKEAEAVETGGPFSGRCVAASLAATYAVAEDAATLLGAGLALKGVRGARTAVQAARVGRFVAAERLSLASAGAVPRNTTMARTALSNVGTVLWDASTSAGIGTDYSVWNTLGGLVPVWNAFTAISQARTLCRERN